MLPFLKSAPSTAKPGITDIAAQVAQGKMLLIDVREIAEARASGIAEGAKVLPLSLLPVKADPRQPGCDLPQGLPVAVYCASGGRSGMAVDVLKRLGYGEVTNLGGLRDWAAGGGRVVPF